MAKERRPAADFAVYFLVRVFVCMLQALSPSTARVFAQLLAKGLYLVDKRHREVAHENLRHAFPDLNNLQLDRLVRRVYLHFCTMLVEITHLPRKMHVINWKQHVRLLNGDRIVDCLTGNRPVLIVTGHFGNWEMAGYALGMFGFRTFAIARTLDNRRLDQFLKKFREKTGQTILDKKADYERILKVLSAGGAIATLADQDAGARGLFVDFFGRPASTFKSLALLSLEYDVPLVVIGVPKVAEPMCYQIIAEEVIYPEEYADRPDAVKAITQRYTAALERQIRQHPEQYFWLHRRWKHQPPVRKARAA